MGIIVPIVDDRKARNNILLFNRRTYDDVQVPNLSVLLLHQSTQSTCLTKLEDYGFGVVNSKVKIIHVTGVLCNIQVFTKVMPSLFAPNFEDLFTNTSYAYQVKSLKLEILSSIATDESISVIFQELQRRKENSTCLVALGTNDGEVFTINATSAELKWKSYAYYHR
ncbi:unnamed protein product [Lactuca saligna]|uniref:Uncharacterized protein n=1 Tax=Lactuca saligna TaxID=75948 RepID=A0AA35ZD53_LACSI|nr:unnamed protein product [Lactuca saligna]